MMVPVRLPRSNDSGICTDYADVPAHEKCCDKREKKKPVKLAGLLDEALAACEVMQNYFREQDLKGRKF